MLQSHVNPNTTSTSTAVGFDTEMTLQTTYLTHLTREAIKKKTKFWTLDETPNPSSNIWVEVGMDAKSLDAQNGFGPPPQTEVWKF